ncbi:WS/DGAT/MGAT family O-acyltransferase [Mycolicibacterium fallax]|jgi:WS/DGAT/MGAT family acyltransferase|uniref:Diacylglycerol O-acyltransferase n=1 Tax=Mycolicibacterium fallax TaxID=1793 RepID=A0A1X1RFI4_MYCFA|nr:wax ester/triacylglycerol synthase family O-acyltransferase [Mycolicibacterium fallax]ORV04332.1 diacylglycerol O-acyltransferase [Mycolicibacterium fallax]BBY98520.1 diacylglycerol O-acyltransferase [Mycolicibacterium fallax]
MEQLSVLDAGFLQVEDSDPRISLAIGSVTVLEGPPPGFDELADSLAQRLARAPRLRQAVRTHPLDLEPPHWVDVPDLDLGHHLRHVALPAPGSDTELFALVSDIIERRLDRDYPLWECWVVEGLAEGRWALIIKLHHCIADGVSATAMMAAFSDDGELDSFATQLPDAHSPDAPADAGPLSRISLNPLDWGKAVWELSSGAADLAAQTVRGTLGIVGDIVRPTSGNSLNGPVGSLRRYRAARVSIDDIRAIGRAFDATFNDVALAAVTHGYRQVLLHRGETPRHDSLRTLIPVSVRDTAALHTPDNRVSLMLPLLPVDEPTPLAQLKALRLRMRRAKSNGQRQAGANVVGAANRFLPFPLTAWTVRAVSRLPQRNVTGLATNVPGPRQPVRMFGRRVLTMLPIPPLALRLRVGIAMLSYTDQLTFGILADYDSSPDLEVLVDGIESAIAGLAELARRA